MPKNDVGSPGNSALNEPMPDLDADNAKLIALRKRLAIALEQAHQGEHSDRTVAEIAQQVLAEDDSRPSEERTPQR